jgi:hypothetical protein
VYEDELHMHQRTRGRSSHEKARKSVKEQVRAATEKETIIPIHYDAQKRSAPEYRKRIVDEKIKYHSDDSSLLPDTATKQALFADNRETDEDFSAETITEHKIKIAKEDDVVPVAFTKTEKSEIKWNGTIVIKPLEEEGAEASLSSDTAPGTLHLHIHEEQRLTRPSVTRTEEVHDSLAIKDRFLTRLNQAHDLNHGDTSEEMIFDTVTAPGASRVSQNPSKIARHSMPSKKSYSLGIRMLVLLSFFAFYVLPTLFIENTISYSQGVSSTKTPPVLISKYGFTLPSTQDTNASTVISSVRDMF